VLATDGEARSLSLYLESHVTFNQLGIIAHSSSFVRRIFFRLTQYEIRPPARDQLADGYQRRRDFDVAFASLPGLRAGALVIERRFLPWSEQAARSTEAASLFGVLLYVVIDNRPRLRDDYDPDDDPDDI
jgi:hypothetical protein